MSAIFDFSSLLTVLLLLICTCAYARESRATIFDPSVPVVRHEDGCFLCDRDFPVLMNMFLSPKQAQQNGQPPPVLKREGILGFLWKLSRIGERLSPYVSVGCLVMAVHVLFFK